MLAKNATPFAAMGFEQVHRDGSPMAVITCRATYNLFADGRMALANQQALVLADQYNGSPLNSGLVQSGDLVAYKPGTDITVIGYTYAPDSQRLECWNFGLGVNDHSRILRAHGLRDWVPNGKQDGKPHWRMSEVKPVDFVPLDYRYAQGSSVLGSAQNDPNGENPIGAFLLDRDISPADTITPVAMIDSENAPVTDPFCAAPPQGLGLIAPFWKSRLDFVGTTDKAWQENRFPQYPEDFDYRFNQSASPGLIIRNYLKGDETITAHNLTLGGGKFIFRLPAIQPYARFDWIDDRTATAKLNLDGVHIDMRNKDAPWRVDLTWRGWAAICPQFFKIDLFMTELGSPLLDDLLACDEFGLIEPDGTQTASFVNAPLADERAAS